MRRSFERAPWITMPKREFTSAPGEIDGGEQQREAEIVELRPVGEIEQVGELAAAGDGQAVVAAVAVEADAEVIDHLREGERDHDEVDAARAQRERADDQREQRGDGERDRPLHEAGRDAFLRQDADRVAADAEIGGMAEAHHAAVAEDQVEAGRRERRG